VWWHAVWSCAGDLGCERLAFPKEVAESDGCRDRVSFSVDAGLYPVGTNRDHASVPYSGFLTSDRNVPLAAYLQTEAFLEP
jgi:hypothetical protein